MPHLQVGLIEKPHNLLELVPDVAFVQNYSRGGGKKKTHPQS